MIDKLDGLREDIVMSNNHRMDLIKKKKKIELKSLNMKKENQNFTVPL